jgi:hypothetical protein
MSLSPIDALASGYTVIVPNNRAQQTWTDLYLKKGKTLPGQLLQSFSEFVTSLIKRNKAFFKQRILTDQQAMIALLQSLPQTFHRDCGQQFLHSFIQAYKLIGRWRCSIDELKNYRLTQEQQYFYEQAPLFKKWLEQQHLMTLEMAIEALLGENNCIWSSPNYFFYGFDDFYPLQEALFAKMRQDGINLVFDKVVPIH